MSSKKEDEGSKDSSCEKNDGEAPLLRDWNVSDDDESVGEHIILPGVISTDKIVDMNSNKTSFTPKSVAVYGTQTQTSNDDELSFSNGVPSPVLKRKKVVPSTKSTSHHTMPGGDVGANNVSDENIDSAQNDDDVRNYSTKKRKWAESPHMVPPVKRSPCIKSDESSLDKCMGNLFEDANDPFNLTRSIQDLEVVFDCVESIPPVPKSEVRNILERRMQKVDMDVVLRQLENKTATFMKTIRDHGLVHKGDNMGQVSWIILGEKDKELQLQGDVEGNIDDMFQEVGPGTRASARVRRSRRLSLKDDIPKGMAEEDDVYEFHDDLVGHQGNDDDDFVDNDMKADTDFDTNSGKSRKGKGRGRGKGKKDGKVGVGRGRGRGRKNAQVVDNLSIQQFYGPVQSKDKEEENIIVDEGTLSPLTASCNMPGVSGLRISQEYYALGRRSSPGNKPLRGSCPMCMKEFDMVVLQRHAFHCEG